MKKSVISILMMFVLVSYSAAESKFIKAEHVTFAGLEVFAQVVKRTVACVQIEGDQKDASKENDWKSLGTAFLVKAENTIYAITCNHVIDKHLNKKEAIHIAIETDKEFRRAPCEVVFQDPEKDIAVLLPKKSKTDAANITNLQFTLDDFADPSLLIEGKAVIIPGYPLGLGTSTDDNHPVIRFGIIAQYTGNPFFLIDGVASHGNSGSPVYSLKDRKIAGMVTSYLNDHISLLDENGQLAARLPYNSGLGRAVTAKELHEALQKAITK